MKHLFISALILTILWGLIPSHTVAATKSNFPIAVYSKTSRDKKSVSVTFSNLKGVSKISYTLSYDTNGTTQGAVGSIKLKNSQPFTRKIVLGTCSSGVCRYHQNIRNAVLEVTVSTKKGTFNRSFSIKV